MRWILLQTPVSAEETSSSKSEEQQDGRLLFAEIYKHSKDGRYPSSFFSKLISKHSERAKLFMVKGTQLYYVRGGRYYSNSNAAAYMLIAL